MMTARDSLCVFFGKECGKSSGGVCERWVPSFYEIIPRLPVRGEWNRVSLTWEPSIRVHTCRRHVGGAARFLRPAPCSTGNTFVAFPSVVFAPFGEGRLAHISLRLKKHNCDVFVVAAAVGARQRARFFLLTRSSYSRHRVRARVASYFVAICETLYLYCSSWY